MIRYNRHNFVVLVLLAPLFSLAATSGCTQEPRESRHNGQQNRPAEQSPEASNPGVRSGELRKLVREQRVLSARSVESYKPKVQAKLNQLNVAVRPLLEQLPGEVHVDAYGPTDRPVHRIVHLSDWHFVPKSVYSADLRDLSKVPLSDEKIDELYEQLLLEVELLQLEQKALLRCLIKHHGLDHIYVEGLTERDMPIFKAKLTALKQVAGEIQNLQEQRGKVILLLESGDSRQELSEAIDDIDKILAQYRMDRLQIGAAGQLLLDEEIDEVLPVEDTQAYEDANPVMENGGVVLDRRKIETRQDAQVRRLLQADRCSLVILGGAHDLSDNIDRISCGTCEYVKITTRWYREFALTDSE